MSPQRPLVSRGGRVMMGRGGRAMSGMRGGRGPGRPAVMSRGGAMMGRGGGGGGLVQRSPQGSMQGMRSRGGGAMQMVAGGSLANGGLGMNSMAAMNSGLVSRPRAAVGVIPAPRGMQLQVWIPTVTSVVDPDPQGSASFKSPGSVSGSASASYKNPDPHSDPHQIL